ncbi:MAG TPA: DUF429 domain-containing protein [Roseiflexaceae bacterium]|nr:DUF429 domain-containing protein [Roseiflexaceae bacterium]
MHFIGIDLAWSGRNRSGAAAAVGDVGGGVLVDHALLTDDRSILDYIDARAGGGPAIVAVDAPLRVPNAVGRRPCEGELAAVFGRYQAGAHPANRRLLARDGIVRGEALVAELEQRGFAYTDRITAGVPVRAVLEIYPHPATVALFGLERTLKYKSKPGRSAEVRHSAWREYQRHLRALAQADPPLRGHGQLLERDPVTLSGQRLKDYEDQVDALMCAYIALYAFRWGDQRCQAFGTLDTGSIYTPVPGEMRNASCR